MSRCQHWEMTIDVWKYVGSIMCVFVCVCVCVCVCVWHWHVNANWQKYRRPINNFQVSQNLPTVTVRPTQSIIYVPLQVNRFQKSILLIVQYKYWKSCSWRGSSVYACMKILKGQPWIYRDIDLRGPAMGWLRLVGSKKLLVSFAKEPYKWDNILQKRPIILSILLTIATP